MSNYDGSIRVGTKIETKEAERELKSLESSISKTANKIASLRSKMDALKDVKLPTQQYADLDKELSKLGAGYDKIAERQQKFLSTGGKESSSTYKRMEYDLEKLDQRQDEVIAKMKELEESGKAFTLGSNTEEYAQMTAQMEQLSSSMQADQQRTAEIQASLAAEEQRLADIKANAAMSDQNMVNLLERRKQLTQEIAEMERAGLGYGYEKYNAAQQELSAINNQIKEYSNNLKKVPEQFTNMKKSAKKAFDAVSSGVKKSGGLLSVFSNRLKGMALSLFIFNWINKAFNSMISGMKQGFSNFMNYSADFTNSVQSMKNAMSTLGNQFAAAFAPIVQMVIPWLTKLINSISTAMTYVAQFIAILGGKSTFTRAKQVQDGYNKSLGGTAAAAKKAYGALAKFDDLDVLQKKEEDSDIGGGAADAMGDLFEEVPVDSKFKDWLDGILQKLKPILDYAKKLWDLFKQGAKDAWDFLNIDAQLENIKDNLLLLKDALIDIFTDPAVVASFKNLLETIAYSLGIIAISMFDIGVTIAQNIVGGITKYFDQNRDRIKKALISIFDVQAEIWELAAEFALSFAYVFQAFGSENGQQLTANIIGIFADGFLGALELAEKLARDILNAFIQPFVDNREALRTALEGSLGVLAEVAGTIKQGIDDTFDKLNEVYDAHFKPFFDSVAQGLSDLVGHFIEFWNGNVQPILESWAELFDELWTSHIQPLIDNVIELLGGLSDMLLALWENVLKPLIDWVIDYVLPPVLIVIDGITEATMAFAGFIADIINVIIDDIKGIVKFLTDVFKGDWESAWNDIVESFNGSTYEKVKEAGGHFIQGLKEGISNQWESLKEQVGNVANSIVDKFKDTLGIHSPSTVMEDKGEYVIIGLLNGIASKMHLVAELWNTLKDDMISALDGMGAWFSDFWTDIFASVSVILQNIQLFFLETWTAIYETTVEIWTGIQEWFIEYWTLFIEFLTETWENILLIFTEKWEEIQLLFDTFIEFLTTVFIVAWEETWLTAGEKYQVFHDLLTMLSNAIKEMLTVFMKNIQLLINTDWKKAWNNAENIFIEFKGSVEEVVEEMRGIIQSFFDWVMGLVAEMLSAIESVGSAISSISGGVGGAGISAYSINPTQIMEIPHLASGSVIRGGNPFLAMLGDQPHGQTNIEAPLSTIKQAVREELSGLNYGGGLNPTISLNVNGEEFARLTLNDILSEMSRQGYDVDVLGVT